MSRTVSLAFIAVLPVLAQMQTPPAFEVASVKPTVHGGKDAQGFSRSSADITGPGHFTADNSSLDELIRFAFDLKEYQLFGPVWLNDKSESFDVVAKAPPDTPRKLMRLILQTLLINRFKLAVHSESRILPLYALAIGKNGPKLKTADPAGRKGIVSAGGNVTASKVTMADFATELSRYLRQPVFDKTGIEGAFDISFRYALEDDISSNAPSLFTALQESTGLKLEPSKGPVEVLVVDHIEKAPTEN